MEGVDKLPSSFLFTVAVVIIGTLRIVLVDILHILIGEGKNFVLEKFIPECLLRPVVLQ